MKKYREILKKPIVTEKTLRLARENNDYTFEVALKASKGAIKEAVEEMFNVEVEDVRTLKRAAKNKRVWGTWRYTRKGPWKKAVVKLAEGDEIEGFGIE
ncbi:MAG: 50S ribosomal protein L23 [Patescibacteria group bacterium]|nr:50S ribosomal protein L23 [Patescibacteria group bacterium]